MPGISHNLLTFFKQRLQRQFQRFSPLALGVAMLALADGHSLPIGTWELQFCHLGPWMLEVHFWHRNVNFFLFRGLNSKQNFLSSFCWLYPSKITDFVHSIIHLIFTYSSFKANGRSSKKRVVNKLSAVSVTQKYSPGKTCECVLTGTRVAKCQFVYTDKNLS